MIAFFMGSIALAQEPTIASATDGTVVANVQVAASVEQVRAALADADTASRLPPEVLEVTSASKGSCTVIDVKTEGAWSPLEYQGLRCPTADGWHTSLVKSEDFDGLEVTWKVTPNGTGSAIEYRVRTDLAMAVPASLLQPRMEKSARATVLRLVESLIRK